MIVLKTGKADTKSLQTIPNTTNPARNPNKVPIIENTHSSHQEENYKKERSGTAIYDIQEAGYNPK